MTAYLAIRRLIRISFSSALKSLPINFHKLLFLNSLRGGLKMNEQRNPNTRTRAFDARRYSRSQNEESISFDVDRAVADRLDQIIDELGDGLSEDTRGRLTLATLCELCLTALVDDYEQNKSDSLVVRATENLRKSDESKSD